MRCPDVQRGKEQIDATPAGSVYLSAALPRDIRQRMGAALDMPLETLDTVPMRWIKGDTTPHVDRGGRSFERTHLLYLTDSPGTFCVGEESYPITRGSAFVFPEGVRHETRDTGAEPRLMVGPMSEGGFAVGAVVEIPCCARPDAIKGVDYTRRVDILRGSTLLVGVRRSPMSYEDRMAMIKAAAAR